MRDHLRELAGQTFGMPSADVPEDASTQVLSEWDSLSHIELMLALEMEYGVQIPSDVLPELLSLDAIEAYLREQGVNGAG
jgi:acyl carrier protein